MNTHSKVRAKLTPRRLGVRVAALPQAVVVDDDPDILRAVRVVLESRGYEVHAADNGSEALDHLAELPAVDLLVTDLVMPRVDGLSVITNARSEFPDLPVVAITGADQAELRLLCAELEGAGSVLTKPFDTRALLDAVDEALR